MPNGIAQHADRILRAIAESPREDQEQGRVTGEGLAQRTGLQADDINDAITVLVDSGLVEWIQWMGTAPYVFGAVSITPRGRFELETAQEAKPDAQPQGTIRLPTTPVGSPYGFLDADWELVAERRAQSDTLFVVMGYQFESTFYDAVRLRDNVQQMFQAAVAAYGATPGAFRVVLNFRPLAAGYGEHLFNEIARDIIAADIAVFETSDLNANVMVEMGVALTWGVRVLPIKRQDRPRPPSDISGQTWADYAEDGARYVDGDHEEKLVRMVERAARKKARGAA